MGFNLELSLELSVYFSLEFSLEFSYEVSESSVGITIGLFNKTTTRLPESMFVQWHPFVAGEQATAATTEGVSWAAKSLGVWVDSLYRNVSV